MRLQIRPFRPDDDLDAVCRIWREVDWVDGDDADEDRHQIGRFMGACDVEVGLLDGAAECSVARAPGSIRYQHTPLPMAAIAAVTTSHVARKQGLATALTARAVRAGAEAGAAVAALGMFDQGFYDRLGFAPMGYDHEVTVDPTTLLVDHVPYRRPIRLTADDHEEIHHLMSRRAPSHGQVVIDPPELLDVEIRWLEKPFGLGYRDDDGRLTHAMLGERTGEHGPYVVKMIGYERPEQLLDLLRLLRELADQIHSVRLTEPAEVQLQDLIATPVAQNRRTRGSIHQAGITASAWMELRILDLERCVAAGRHRGPAVRCNLLVTDPIEAQLERADQATGPVAGDPDHRPRWAGVAGSYVLDVGADPTVTVGHDPDLATLEASVGAFSRWWFGVGSASRLALTDELAGPTDLLAELDEAVRLPPPVAGWDF